MHGKSRLDHWIASTLILLALIGVVVAIWFWLPDQLAPHIKDIKDRGVYGDSYGAVSSLFTGLGFAGLVFTILLQQREIKLQRDDFFPQLQEMQQTRDEVVRQSRLQELQLKQSIVQLKFSALQIEVEQIKVEGLQWQEHNRLSNIGPKLMQVQNRMESLISSLEADA